MPRRSALFLGLFVAAVLAAIAAGLYMAGPPTDARARKLDSLRTGDLYRLSRRIETHFRNHQALPDQLAELKLETADATADPGSATPYRYRARDRMSFELCADFDSSQTRETDARIGKFEHPRGPYCFVFIVKATPTDKSQRFDVEIAP